MSVRLILVSREVHGLADMPSRDSLPSTDDWQWYVVWGNYENQREKWITYDQAVLSLKVKMLRGEDDR